METHKEIFTRYLSEAPRWENYRGEHKIKDWDEWLMEQDIVRCSLTGVYGMLGDEVHYRYDYDQPVRIDGIYPLKFLAHQKGFEVEKVKIDGEWVLEVIVEHEKASNVFDVGEVMYRFCDTDRYDKEKRLESWLEVREDLEHRGSKWEEFKE